MTIIPAGSSARWDIPGPVEVVQLYLPPTTLQRIADEADVAAPSDLLERTGHPDLTTSRLLMSAADVIEGSAALDALFRQQLTDLLATRILAAHTGSPATFQPIMGGLSPAVLRRTIERLRSDSDADVSLAALASDAGLSRFHFCRAFKESTGLSPHAWLRQYRLEQAMNMLRDTDTSVVSVAAALGYSSRRPLSLRRSESLLARPRPIGGDACVSSNLSTGTAIALGQSQIGSAKKRSKRRSHQQPEETKMAWKILIGPHAIASRRRIVASALMYGLSLTVRFTSATGDETENPTQAAQSTNPMPSIMIKDGVPTFRYWPPKLAHSIAFQRSGLLNSARLPPGM